MRDLKTIIKDKAKLKLQMENSILDFEYLFSLMAEFNQEIKNLGLEVESFDIAVGIAMEVIKKEESIEKIISDIEYKQQFKKIELMIKDLFLNLDYKLIIQDEVFIIKEGRKTVHTFMIQDFIKCKTLHDIVGQLNHKINRLILGGYLSDELNTFNAALHKYKKILSTQNTIANF